MMTNKTKSHLTHNKELIDQLAKAYKEPLLVTDNKLNIIFQTNCLKTYSKLKL